MAQNFPMSFTTTMSGPSKRGRARAINPANSIVPKAHRVARACDNCRLRKSKCDGRLPCTFCTIHRFDCAYDTSRPKPQLSTKYIISLERDIERLKDALGLDRDAELTDEVLNKAAARCGHDDRNQDTPSDAADSSEAAENTPSSDSTTSMPHALLETMVEATGQLSIDERGNCDYCGNIAGLTLIRRIRERCDALLEGSKDDQASQSPESFRPVSSPVRSPSMSEDSRPCYTLPPRDVALHHIATAFTCALPLSRFIHEPSFYARFERFYIERQEMSYVSALSDIRFEALLNELFGLGILFSTDPQSGIAAESAAKAELYFRRGSDLIDITDCRDLTSLQALMCMVIYLQCCGAIPTCYTYISLATAACTRMGLHRSESSRQLNPIDQETRKRLFWALRTIDVYVTTILGLPRSLSDEDVDQELPKEVDDKYITEDGIGDCNCNSTCPMTAANAYTKLILIMARIRRNVLNFRKSAADQTEVYRVDYTRIMEAENELETWYASLPGDTYFAKPVSTELIKAHLLLRLMYAHVQMVLYRPFLHHITKKKTDEDFDIRAFACASACIQAAMQVVWLDEALDSKGLLRGSYWFIFFTTFISVICLLMFVLSNKNDPTAQESLSAAVRGYRIFIKFAKSNSSARNFAESLRPLFDRLAAENLCEVPTLSFHEESSRQTADPSSLPQSMPAASNDFDVESFLMQSPPITAQSSAVYATPDAADLEPHLQAMCYPPGDTLQYFGGDDGMMDGVLTFGNQYTDFGGGFSGLPPLYGMGDQGF